jgi:predicted AlkP superfamily phosphohydrolase/phosphomutase
MRKLDTQTREINGPAASHARGPADPEKRATLKKLAALGLLACLDGSLLSSCGKRSLPSLARERKVIILGIDGLDAWYVDRLMGQGKLPHMSRLRTMGGFRPLASSVPPQSPVAWATFITGRDPGGHGLYDFVQRDPQTYQPYLCIARTEEPRRKLPLGQWRLPISRGKVELLREGRAFWDLLDQQGLPCAVYRAPSNFPPRDTGAKQLAGLGAPDLRGTYGEYSYFTDAVTTQGEMSGGATYPVQVLNGRVEASIIGPRNTLREGEPESAAQITVWVDRDSRAAKLVVQDQEVLLKQGEWSPWVPITFTLLPHLKGVTGICRFYLKEVAPHFKLYVTPVNIDPFAPALPVAAPEGFAAELAARYGRFYTQGFPEDVKALRHGVLDEAEYLHQSALAMSEARRMYEDGLHEFRRGILFHYFSASDRTQHMFWRTMDPRHPMYDAKLARDYGSAIEDCYREADVLVGQAMEATDSSTCLIVMSDHGFAPFYRNFQVNAWLAANGYLVGLEPWKENPSLLENADWSQTVAYGMGFNGVYVNVAGREGRGSVPAGERLTVARKLARELRQVRDPGTGQPVIDSVSVSDEVYRSNIRGRAPDLIIGYARGYRCGDDSVLGEAAGPVVSDNLDKWSGDHCIDRDAVPGVLLTNREIRADHPDLTDLTVSVLAEFGLPKPDDMSGHPAW